MTTRRRIGLAASCLLVAAVPFTTLDRLDLHHVAFLTFAVLLAGMRLLPEYRRHLALFFSLLIVFVLAGEAVFRLSHFGPAGLSFRAYRPAGYAGPWSAFEYDLATFTGLKPHAVFMLRGKPFRVNGDGFRGRDISRPKPEGVYRIAITGASAMMGPGVDEDAIAPALIEKKLNSRGLPMRVEVVNLSVGATRIPEMLFILENAAPVYEPDMELLLANRNLLPSLPFEPRFSRPRRINEPLWRRITRGRYNFCSEWFFFLNLMFDFRHDLPAAISSHAAALLGKNRQEPDSAAQDRERIAAVLERFAVAAGQARPAVFLLRPIMALDDPELERDYRRLLRDAAARRSMPVIDTYELDLRGFNPADLILYPGDNHPNERAHSMFAEYMADALEPVVREDMLRRKDRTSRGSPGDSTAVF